MFGVPARNQTGDVATQDEATSSSRMSMIASAGDQHRCDTVNHADTTRHHCTRDFMNNSICRASIEGWGVGDIAIPCSYISQRSISCKGIHIQDDQNLICSDQGSRGAPRSRLYGSGVVATVSDLSYKSANGLHRRRHPRRTLPCHASAAPARSDLPESVAGLPLRLRLRAQGAASVRSL